MLFESRMKGMAGLSGIFLVTVFANQLVYTPTMDTIIPYDSCHPPPRTKACCYQVPYTQTYELPYKYHKQRKRIPYHTTDFIQK